MTQCDRPWLLLYCLCQLIWFFMSLSSIQQIPVSYIYDQTSEVEKNHYSV